MGILTETAVSRLRAMVDYAGPGQEDQLMEGVLRLAAKWRSQMLANTAGARGGPVIQGGPFAGMRYGAVAEGALMARLMGSYESELHPYLAAFAREGLDHVVDIGCAEGYYAVGLARMLPQATIHAFDTEPNARALCAELAAANAVSDRVHIGATFSGEDFDKFVGKRALFIVDIEGGESELLDPERYPALRALQLIVETHPQASPGITDILFRRFSQSHAVEVVRQGAKTAPLPAWVGELGHLDGLLSVWEWRSRPTPWLVMKPKG